MYKFEKGDKVLVNIPNQACDLSQRWGTIVERKDYSHYVVEFMDYQHYICHASQLISAKPPEYILKEDTDEKH